MITPQARFFFSFYKWSRDKSFIDPNKFREICKYITLDLWKKDMIDEYIKGRMESRCVGDIVPWTN